MDDMPSSRTVWSRLGYDPAKAMDLLVRRYQEPLCRFAQRHRQGITREDAEEITQNLFLRICKSDFLKKADRLKGSFRGYLLTTMKNEIASFLGHELAGKRDRRRTAPLDIDIPAETTADDEFDRDWVKSLFDQVVEELGDGPDVRAYHLWREGKSHREVATELAKSESEVNNYIHRTKKRIRNGIERLIREEHPNPEDYQEEIARLRKII